MLCIHRRTVTWCDRRQLTARYVYQYFSDIAHMRDIIMVHDRERFSMSLAAEEVYSLPGVDGIQAFIESKANTAAVIPSTDMFDDARALLAHNPAVRSLPVIAPSAPVDVTSTGMDFIVDVNIPGIGLDMVRYIRNMELQDTLRDCFRTDCDDTLELGSLNELNYQLYLLGREIGVKTVLHGTRWSDYLGVKSLHERDYERGFSFEDYLNRNARWTYDAVSELWAAHVVYKASCYRGLVERLHAQGVPVACCNIDAGRVADTPETTSLLHKLMYSIDLLATPVGDLYFKPAIYNCSPAEFARRMESRSPIRPLGSGPRNLYLLGPCTIGADNNFEGDRMFEVLARKLEDAGIGYRVVPVLIGVDAPNDFNELLSRDIQSDDLVLILDHVDEATQRMVGERRCVDATKVFDACSDTDWLFTDTRFHTTAHGNRVLAEAMMDRLIVPAWGERPAHALAHAAERRAYQLTPRHRRELREYLDRYRDLKVSPQDGLTVGSISMNANPFTKGHRHLVEYAASRVDRLLVFVVEENASAISFHDRYEMVRRGCADLSNVVVLPSGSVQHTLLTMPDYFRKETIDSTEEGSFWRDVYVFTHEIAPYFGITKRFLGKEPTDPVTAEYNRELAAALPECGMEAVIIDRKGVEGVPISGTAVREAARKHDWAALEPLVPSTTFEYLKEHADTMFSQERSRRATKAGL